MEVGEEELGVDRVHFPRNMKEGVKLPKAGMDRKLRQSVRPRWRKQQQGTASWEGHPRGRSGSFLLGLRR